MASVLTIGHSNHAIADFLRLLRQHAVGVVADVRSAPYSRFSPHFNREALRGELRGAAIGYTYLGSELGGRSDDPKCYRNGRICYGSVARTQRFKDGLRRLTADLAKGMAEHRIALMCAEKEPLHCHRALLVAPALHAEGVEISHIHADGELESHTAAMGRLLASFDLHPQDNLFGEPRRALVEVAIRRQTSHVGHTLDASRTAH